MTINMWIATTAWLLLVAGYLRRRDRRLHVRLMVSGIVLDILLVLYLQVTRSAIQSALAFSLKILQQVHIGFSTVALLLYFPVLYLGVRLVRGEKTPGLRERHMRVALAALAFRTLGFIFMFSMWGGAKNAVP